MSKFKLYGIIFLAVLFFGMGISLKILIQKNKAQKTEIARVQENNMQLMAENRQITNLALTQKEIIGKISREVDSLAKQLKIKPKQITKIVYIDIYTRDTIKVPVYVTVTGKNQWNISDSSKCFKWTGKAYLTEDSLKIDRTLYEDRNKITQAFYKVRPFRFLFIRYGRWQYLQSLSSTCGNTKELSIDIIKR